MKVNLQRFISILILTLSSVVMTNVTAQDDIDEDDEFGREAVRCVALNRINNLEILDNQNIVFHMRGGDIYLNILPHACAGISRNDQVMFRTSLGEICNVDVITKLNNIGPGFQPGVSCGLGMFNPATPEEITRLKGLLGQ